MKRDLRDHLIPSFCRNKNHRISVLDPITQQVNDGHELEPGIDIRCTFNIREFLDMELMIKRSNFISCLELKTFLKVIITATKKQNKWLEFTL